jgi:hypothetical protein
MNDGAMPTWPRSRIRAYGAGGGLGLVVLIIVILLLRVAFDRSQNVLTSVQAADDGTKNVSGAQSEGLSMAK